MRPTPPNVIPRLRRYGILNLDAQDNVIFLALITRTPMMAAIHMGAAFKRKIQRLSIMRSKIWTTNGSIVGASHLCRHPEFPLVSPGGKLPIYELDDHPTKKDELYWKKVGVTFW